MFTLSEKRAPDETRLNIFDCNNEDACSRLFRRRICARRGSATQVVQFADTAAANFLKVTARHGSEQRVNEWGFFARSGITLVVNLDRNEESIASLANFFGWSDGVLPLSKRCHLDVQRMFELFDCHLRLIEPQLRQPLGLLASIKSHIDFLGDYLSRKHLPRVPTNQRAANERSGTK